MADSVLRDVIIRVSIQQVETKFKTPDITPVARAQDTLERQRDRHHKEEQRRAKERERAEKAAAAAAERFAREREQQQQRIAQAQAVSIQRFREAGEGAFTLARGLAFTFSSTNEGLQTMIRNVAAVQGIFDIFKGGTQVVKALALSLNPVTLGIGAIVGLVGGLASAFRSAEREGTQSVSRLVQILGTLKQNADAVSYQLKQFQTFAGGTQKRVDVLLGAGRIDDAKRLAQAPVVRAEREYSDQRQIVAGQIQDARTSGRQQEINRLRGLGFDRPERLADVRTEAAVSGFRVNLEQKRLQLLQVQEEFARNQQRIQEAERQQIEKTLSAFQNTKGPKSQALQRKTEELTQKLIQSALESDQTVSNLDRAIARVTDQQNKLAEVVAKMEAAQLRAGLQNSP